MMVTPDVSPAVQRFRRSLDRAVIRGSAVRMAAIVGCWCTSAAVLWCAVLAVRQGLAADFLVTAPMATMIGIATLAGLVTAAIFRDAVFRGQWPNRLAVALETERRDASLRERLSRAVAFLDEPLVGSAEGSADAGLSSGLRCLAIEQAAAALPKRLAVPGEPADIKWIGAGGLAAAAALLTALVMPTSRGGAKQEEDTAGTAVTMPAAGAAAGAGNAARPAARAALVRRLRAAAAVERRVAAVAATLFAESPGAMRASLPRASQARLEQLAAIQAEVCGTVRSVRQEIRSLTGTPAECHAACLEQLDAFGIAGGETIGGHVIANRLGLAGDRAAAAADSLAAAAAALAADTGAAEVEGPILDDPRLARATLGLDELAAAGAQAADDAAPISSGRASSAAATETATGPARGTAPATPSTVTGQGDEPGGSMARGDAATASPRQGSTGEVATQSADDQPRGPVARPSAAPLADRGWRPPAPQIPASSATSTWIPEDAPAAYRQAVAEYYRLLRPLPAKAAAATESRPELPKR
jgi:hypothetical protein